MLVLVVTGHFALSCGLCSSISMSHVSPKSRPTRLKPEMSLFFLVEMALVKGADTNHMAETISSVAKTVFDGAAMVFIGVDLDQIDKMASRRLQRPLELNQQQIFCRI